MEKSLKVAISDIISTLDIPANIQGFKYLREAVINVVKDNVLGSALTRELYPLIAKEFETTSSKVERAIRHAINIAYNSEKISALNRVFNVDVFSKYDKPSNGEVISFLAERLILMGY